MRHVLIMLAIIAIVTGCGPLVVGGGAAVGMAGLQERTVGAAVDDSVIWTRIKNAYVQENIGELTSAVDVDVNEGRVLLTGSVKEPKTRVDAVRLAWQPEGVKEVINEIQITGNQGIASYAKDAWITARIKSRLLLHKNVESINYTIDTVNRVVYVMGIAQNQAEHDLVMKEASSIAGVEKVINHARIKERQIVRDMEDHS
jgi:osmotically-inducible protein OsmY